MIWLDYIVGDFLRYLIGGLVLLQTICLVALLIQGRRYLRVKAASRRQQTEIMHAARLLLVGEITASITHEVTQPLSAILNNIEAAQVLLQTPHPNLDPVREILRDVRQDDLRAYSIVQRLRGLLRKRELQFENVNINTLAANVLALVRSDAANRHVMLHTVLDADVPAIVADPIHLQQVLLNLIINAMDAMRETPVRERSVDVRTELREGTYVQVTVADHGHGISAANESKLFDSFFTTKEEGMGLGLAIARVIVTLHGGAIWAENRAGGGASFTFTLPLTRTAASERPRRALREKGRRSKSK